jgi:hypothetical protein
MNAFSTSSSLLNPKITAEIKVSVVNESVTITLPLTLLHIGKRLTTDTVLGNSDECDKKIIKKICIDCRNVQDKS